MAATPLFAVCPRAGLARFHRNRTYVAAPVTLVGDCGVWRGSADPVGTKRRRLQAIPPTSQIVGTRGQIGVNTEVGICDISPDLGGPQAAPATIAGSGTGADRWDANSRI